MTIAAPSLGKGCPHLAEGKCSVLGHPLRPGVGLLQTQPSLGTATGVRNDFLFSGEWWITIFPGAALVIPVSAINGLATGCATPSTRVSAQVQKNGDP